jgi:F-type H+-transporting ATPase subunit b
VKRTLLAMMLLFGAASMHAQEKTEEPLTKDEMIVWKWANFVILAAGAGYLMGKHLPEFFKSRSADIQKDITEAQATKRTAEARAAEMDARLSSLSADIEKFRVQAKIEMAQEAERIRQDTAHQIEKLQQQAQQEIESAGNLAGRELREYAAKLSLDLAEQRIRTRLDAGTEAGLVDDFTTDLQKQGSRN